MALTDTEMRRSKSAEKPYKLSDSGGLHLLVTPAGGKLWRWKYRFGGSEKLMALGRYPEIPLADARERRDAARKQLAHGADPMAARMAKNMAIRSSTASCNKIILQKIRKECSETYVKNLQRLEIDCRRCLCSARSLKGER